MRLRALACLLFAACVTDTTVAPLASRTLLREVRAQTAPLNFVFVLSDDQTKTQMTRAFMPLTWAHLADSGVVFVNYFTNPECCPARVSLITGRYAHDHGIIDNVAPEGGFTVFNDAVTLASVMHDAGYLTGWFGKYLNEYNDPTHVPPGVDEWRVSLDPVAYFTYTNVSKAYDSSNVYTKTYGTLQKAYQTTTVKDDAIKLIQRSASDPRPLFLVLAPKAPHGPSTPSTFDNGTNACSTLPNWRPPSYNEADVSDQPAFVQALGTGGNQDAMRKKQCRTIRSVDRMVDSLVTALAVAGRLANTCLVFVSDNGYHGGEHRLFTRKRTLYRESVEGYAFVRCPGLTPRVDSTCFAHVVDLAPTILALAGVANTLPNVNGQDLAPRLANPLAACRDDALLENLPSSRPNEVAQGVQNATWAYHEYADGERALYHLPSDPYQIHNVANDSAGTPTLATLAARLAVLRAQ